MGAADELQAEAPTRVKHYKLGLLEHRMVVNSSVACDATSTRARPE